MMSLSEQIIGIIFSFCYGCFLSVLYNFNYNLLFNLGKIKKLVFNILFIFDLVLIYFLIIRKINNAVIHPYFYLFIVLGFLSVFSISKKLRSLLKVPKVKEKSKKMPKNVKKN